MSTEMTGRWEELVPGRSSAGIRCGLRLLTSRPRSRKATIGWKIVARMASNGVRIIHPADDSRESIYEGTE